MVRFLKLFRKKKSFTLIELIMTIVVVGIVVLPISVILAKHVQSVFVSQDYTSALNLARFKMEEVLSTPYASIAIGTTSSSYPGYAYNVITTVSETKPKPHSNEGLKLVIVSVVKPGSATALITLRTYIAKNVTVGS
ncbi:MAG: prepilin-type N-terminal cleavage/methylation domain-containing protein [Candidatus Omnitrophota bacterium]|jgi:Tfp pilus assembly protein PilV|nr:prepilin-type N-terminal cleavage/methylation domain-containing protein [Candidatus Omnitrophota bacterium]